MICAFLSLSLDDCGIVAELHVVQSRVDILFFYILHAFETITFEF